MPFPKTVSTFKRSYTAKYEMLFYSFVDLEKAFDRVRRRSGWMGWVEFRCVRSNVIDSDDSLFDPRLRSR